MMDRSRFGDGNHVVGCSTLSRRVRHKVAELGSLLVHLGEVPESG